MALIDPKRTKSKTCRLKYEIGQTSASKIREISQARKTPQILNPNLRYNGSLMTQLKKEPFSLTICRLYVFKIIDYTKICRAKNTIATKTMAAWYCSILLECQQPKNHLQNKRVHTMQTIPRPCSRKAYEKRGRFP